MSSSGYFLCSRVTPFAAVLIQACLATAACGQIGTLTPIFIEGNVFAHSVQFPSRFRAPDTLKRPFVLDHYRFRSSRKSPNSLLVAACRSVNLSEICSLNAFVIDVERGFTTREAEAGEWEQGVPVRSLEMDYPMRRTIKEEYAKPAFLRPVLISNQSQEREGFKYRGSEYRRRGDWIGSLAFGSSEDGSLIVLAGADKRKFPDQRPAYVASAIYTWPNGLLTIDVYAGDPSHHIAALDLDCHTTIDTARRGTSLVDSRWLAIAVSPLLGKMLLLDFKPAREPTK